MKNTQIIKAFNKIAVKSRGIAIIDRTVLVNSKALTVTDLETVLSVPTPAHWKVEGVGVVPLDLIKTALTAASVLMAFNTENNTVRAEIDGRIITAPAMDSFDFPNNWPRGDWAQAGQVGASCLYKVVDFISRDDLRPAMMGVYIGGGELVGTNGHYLRRVLDSRYNGPEIILRATAAAAAAEFFGGYNGPETTFNVALNSGQVFLSNRDGVEIYSRLIDEKYPNYKAVIPEGYTASINVDRKELRAAVKSARGSVNKSVGAVQVCYDGQDLVITGQDLDNGARSDIKIDANWSKNMATGYRIDFNAKYVDMILSNVESETITLSLGDNDRAAIVNGDILLMPVRQAV